MTHSLNTTRRRVLQGLGLGAGLTAATTVVPVTGPGIFGPNPVGAAPPPGRVVVVFLRGGIDGLSACVPYLEPNYYAARPDISIPPAAITDLDGQFGLHPAMTPIHDLYTEGRFAFVSAVANPAANRSHFEAQAFLEQGTAGHSGDGFGWLGRHLNSSSGIPGAEFRAVGLSARSTRSLAGYVDALSISSLERFALGGTGGYGADNGAGLHLFYTGATPADAMGKNTLAAVAEIEGIVAANPRGGTYDDAAATFNDAHLLLGAGLGIEVVTLDIGDWDTHNDMGNDAGGEMNDLLSGLATNLAQFQTDLDAGGHTDVTTIVMSEFGRRVAQNGSGGCDHGYGNLMMAMGAGINGNQVHGPWPGLDPANLVNGDLALRTDFRDVLAEVLADRLGNSDAASVFPGHAVSAVGLTS